MFFWNGLVKKPHQPNGFQCWWNPVWVGEIFGIQKNLLSWIFKEKHHQTTGFSAWLPKWPEHLHMLLNYLDLFYLWGEGSLEPKFIFRCFFLRREINFQQDPPKLHAILRTWGGSVDGDLGVFFQKTLPVWLGSRLGLSSGYQVLGRSQSFSIISWFQGTGETNWKHDPGMGKHGMGRFIQTSLSKHQHTISSQKSLLLFFLSECNLYSVCVFFWCFPFFWGGTTRGS